MIDWRNVALKSAYKEKPFSVFENEIASHATRTMQDMKLKRARIGRAWEEFCCEFLKIRGYETVYLLEECSDDLLSELGLRRRDVGIDILAKRQGEDEWTAVQCKFRARGSVTWTQLATFWALCARSGPWSRQLVMTNAEHVRREGHSQNTDVTMAKGTFSSIKRHEWLVLSGNHTAGQKCGGVQQPLQTADHIRDARASFLARFD